MKNALAPVLRVSSAPAAISWYQRLGFVPGQLTLTLSYEAHRHEASVELLSRLSPAARNDAIAEG